ncbi:MAG TPA: hypothetical protein VKD91_13550 [Pyrinomonadaceae bacterium]|nr:hypothetical protein [Pyrinomonadaceae bacterium]
MCPTKNNRGRTEIIIAAIGAAGVLGAAYFAYLSVRERNKPEAPAPPEVRTPEKKTLEKETWVRLAPDVEVQLKDVETLHGKSKEVNGKFDSTSGIDANNQLDDKYHVFGEVLKRIGRNDDVGQVLAKSPADWNVWLDGLKKEQRDELKEIPFARFLLRVGDKAQRDLAGRYFFAGEVVKAGNVTFEVLKVTNTKARSGEPESVEIRMK